MGSQEGGKSRNGLTDEVPRPGLPECPVLEGSGDSLEGQKGWRIPEIRPRDR